MKIAGSLIFLLVDVAAAGVKKPGRLSTLNNAANRRWLEEDEPEEELESESPTMESGSKSTKAPNSPPTMFPTEEPLPLPV